MSYHNRLAKIENKRIQIAKEEKALELERKEMIRKYDTRRKIFCGAIFLKRMYDQGETELIEIFQEELKKAPQRTQGEFPEFFGESNHVLGDKAKINAKTDVASS